MADPGGSRGCCRKLLTSFGLPYGHGLEEEGDGGGARNGFVRPPASTAGAIAAVAATQEEKAAAVANAPDVKKELVPPARTIDKLADQTYFKMGTGPTDDMWICMNFSWMRPEQAFAFCADLIHLCNANGMNFCQDPLVHIQSASPDHMGDTFRDLRRRTSKLLGKQIIGNQYKLLVIVILSDASGFCGNIQRVCDTGIGDITQCCLLKHARKWNKNYLQKVALEIKAKVRSLDNDLEEPAGCDGTPFVSEEPPPGEVVPLTNLLDNTMYGSLMPAKMCGQEIFAIKNEACEIEVDQKICYPNEFDSYLCGHDGSQKRINGAAISEETSPLHSEKKNVQLKVVFSDRSAVVTVNDNDTAGFVGYTALEVFGAQNADCYLRVGKHVISSDFKFGGSSLLSLELRGRGGSSGVAGSSGAGTSSTATGSKSNVNDYIKRLKKKKDQTWLEKVTLPPGLRRRSQPVIEYTVNLGDDGTLTLRKFLRCFENKHRTGWCFDESLDLKHIFYSETEEVFEIEGVGLSRMTQTSYDNNLKVVLKFVNIHLRYRDHNGGLQYPMYVDDLVKLIQNAGNDRGSCYCNRERSRIYNSLATWSPADIIGLFALVVMNASNLTGQDWTDFMDAIKKDVSSLSWQAEAYGPAAPPVMKNVFNYSVWDPVQRMLIQKNYQSTLYSWSDFARCLLTHGPKYGVTLKQILSSLWIMNPGRTATLQRNLLFYQKKYADVGFTPNAPGIPTRNALAGHQLVGLPKSPDDSDSVMKFV